MTSDGPGCPQLVMRDHAVAMQGDLGSGAAGVDGGSACLAGSIVSAEHLGAVRRAIGSIPLSIGELRAFSEVVVAAGVESGAGYVLTARLARRGGGRR